MWNDVDQDKNRLKNWQYNNTILFFLGLFGSIEPWFVDEMDTGSFLMIPIIIAKNQSCWRFTTGMMMVFIEALKTSWTTSSKVCRPSNMRHWDLGRWHRLLLQCVLRHRFFDLLRLCLCVFVVFLAVSCRCSWTLSLVFDSCLCRFPLDLSLIRFRSRCHITRPKICNDPSWLLERTANVTDGVRVSAQKKVPRRS